MFILSYKFLEVNVKIYKVYDDSSELFAIEGSRNLQKELGKLWVFNILSEHQFTIRDCGTQKEYKFDEIYGCDLEHNIPKPTNAKCCDDCINCKNHIDFIGE